MHELSESAAQITMSHLPGISMTCPIVTARYRRYPSMLGIDRRVANRTVANGKQRWLILYLPPATILPELAPSHHPNSWTEVERC